MIDNKLKENKAVSNNQYVMTFKSVMHAMQFEKVMKLNNIDFKLIPVPRSISSSCGMCGKFKDDLKEIVLELCDKNNVLYDSIHEFIEK